MPGREHPDTPKRFLVLGRDFGAREAPGHGDLAVGAFVAPELFEPIARFLGPDQQPDETSGAEALEEIRARKATPGRADVPLNLPS